MDQLILRSTWKSSATNNEILTLTGLLIEGATFNGTTLTACQATSENINVVPDCSIVWMDRVSNKRFFPYVVIAYIFFSETNVNR